MGDPVIRDALSITLACLGIIRRMLNAIHQMVNASTPIYSCEG